MQKFPQKHILIRLCHIYTGRQQWDLKKEKKKKTGKTLEKDKRTRLPLHISTHNFLLITSLGTSGHVAFALADIRKCNAQRPNPVKTTKSGFLSACLTWASWWGVRTEGKLMRWLVFFFCQDEQIENDNLQWGELGRWLATLRMRKAVVVSPFSWTSSHHKSFRIFFFFLFSVNSARECEVRKRRRADCTSASPGWTCVWRLPHLERSCVSPSCSSRSLTAPRNHHKKKTNKKNSY